MQGFLSFEWLINTSYKSLMADCTFILYKAPKHVCQHMLLLFHRLPSLLTIPSCEGSPRRVTSLSSAPKVFLAVLLQLGKFLSVQHAKSSSKNKLSGSLLGQIRNI